MSLPIASRRLVLAAMPALGLASPTGAQSPKSQEAAIRQLLIHTFERPEAALSLDPVIVEDDAAIVGWIQGDMAGRALLRLTGGQWAIIACAGAAFKAVGTLKRLGVPGDQAARLTARLAAAEANLDAKRVARLDSFGGIMEMGGAPHPPAHRP